MDYKDCPHYNEILKLLTEGEDLSDIGFEIDEVQECKECLEGFNVCELWVLLSFVEDMKPQLSIDEAKVTIDTLDEQMKRISLEMIRGLARNNRSKN